jgi:hypothetical protein
MLFFHKSGICFKEKEFKKKNLFLTLAYQNNKKNFKKN